MAHISEQMNYSNYTIHSYDKMSKIIFNLSSKKYEKQQHLLLPTHPPI